MSAKIRGSSPADVSKGQSTPADASLRAPLMELTLKHNQMLQEVDGFVSMFERVDQDLIFALAQMPRAAQKRILADLRRALADRLAVDKWFRDPKQRAREIPAAAGALFTGPKVIPFGRPPGGDR